MEGCELLEYVVGCLWCYFRVLFVLVIYDYKCGVDSWVWLVVFSICMVEWWDVVWCWSWMVICVGVLMLLLGVEVYVLW